MNPIYHFSVNNRSFHMRGDTIRAMENHTDPKVKAIYCAGIKHVQEYRKPNKSGRKPAEKSKLKSILHWNMT